MARKKTNTIKKRLRFEPYWYLIIPLLLGFGVLFVNHLLSGVTPNRVFIHIAPLDFDIFWYGVCIVGGIALGAYVVTRLMLARGVASLNRHVPKSLRNKPVDVLKLPDEIRQVLAKRRIKTVGDLLLQWGFDFQNLGLNHDGIQEVRAQLDLHSGVKTEWVIDAPWRRWNPEHVWNGVAWCLVLGVIGARLYHVLTPSPSMAEIGIHSPLDYFRNPFQLINLRNGGLGIYGGIAGGALGLFLYTRRQRLPMIAWADMAVVGLALGQVFGRWGNFFNQELYGRPSDLPWAITIDPLYLLPGYSETTRFHPAFLYESLWSLLTFILLLTLARRYSRRLLTGDLMALYLISYSIGRILLESVRLDSRMITIGDTTINMAVATLVSIVIAVFMAGWRVYARFQGRGN